MSIGQQFTTQFGPHIASTLGCFDRVIVSGYLPFWSQGYVNGWVGGKLKILHKDFFPRMKKLSEQLVTFAKQEAKKADAPYLFLKGQQRKEDLVEKIDQERKHPLGLLVVLATIERCRTVRLMYGKNRPYLKFDYRPQRVVYFYLNDPQFGRMFVRIQTWFPWKIQIYINGHDWLARQMNRKNIRFQAEENAFVWLSDPRRAQQMADGFANLNWSKILDRFAVRFNPLLKHSWLDGRQYYWVIDQAEYSTDVLFQDRSVLTDLYPRLLDHAVQTFQAQDIMTFLGRRLTNSFEGEIQSSCSRERHPKERHSGARIKHRVGQNWVKMYDKFGRLLRVETVINNPKDFRIEDATSTPEGQTLVHKRLGKNVKLFPHYLRISRSANLRYLDALSVVKATQTASYQQVAALTGTVRYAGRTYAGFNVASKTDVEFFVALLAGEHSLNGFRVKDLQQLLPAASVTKTRRQAALTLSRCLKRLRVRGLVAKLEHYHHRWKLTPQGATLLGSVVRLYYTGLSTAA